MKRTISPLGLLLTSISAIIGSGWLFSSFYSAQIAGPAALFSWIISGIIITIVAFTFAEICSLLPITGSSTRIPHLTHGTTTSFIFSWIIWVSYMALAPTEVQATIQYLNFYFPSLTEASGKLTNDGYIIAAFLMMAISAINIYSLKWLIKSNSILTLLKIIIPIFVALVILINFYTPAQLMHANNSSFMPFGWHGILAAISGGGIVFAFNGFKQAAEMAGEAENPKFALPFAIIGSIFVCLVIFILLQSAFLVSLKPQNLANGWQNIILPQKGISPFASIIYEYKLSWLFPFLYFAAIIAPMAAGMMYCSSSARSLYGISKNGYLPNIFTKLNAKGNPFYAIIFNFFFGMLMFAPLPGWSAMVDFLSSLIAITYSVGPIALLTLREQLPHKRVFHLPFAKIWATTAFYICTLLTYWSGWKIIFKLDIALFFGCATLITYYLVNKNKKPISLHLSSSIWLWFFFIGISILSYLGSFGEGHNVIPFGWDLLIIAIFSIITVILASKFKLKPHQTQTYLEEMKAEIKE